MILAPLAPLGSHAAPGLAPGAAATVASDANVLLRTEPGYGSDVVYEVAPGTWTTIVSGPYYDSEGLEWFEVDAGGFLPSSALLVDGGGYTDETVTDETVYSEAPAPESASGGYDPNAVIANAWIAGTGGDGAVCRSDASFDSGELLTLWDGESVGVLGDPVGEWQPVSCGGTAGFVHASFISWEQPNTYQANSAGESGVDTREVWEEPAAAPAEASSQQEEGGRARNDGGGNERNGRGGRGGRETGKGRGANAGSDGTTGDGSGEYTRGQEMVDFAMQYVGYPYVYAGEGPHAFDCSGFTLYVARNVLGMEITHDMFTQIELGVSVSRDELQPGDFVYFGDTFRAGLSHVGIYIGNGQFVHAENEDTGVVVTDLNSDYYSSRWYGANRIW
ncbi:MAG: C40 family peptidase [Chloroflexota bacterium]